MFWIDNKLFKIYLKGFHSYKTSVFSKSNIFNIPLAKPQAKNNSLGAATHIGGSLLDTNWKASSLCSSKDPPICVAAPKELFFACGFSSGILKIFDLEKTEVLYEWKPFNKFWIIYYLFKTIN